jgi:hypothetical protein
MMQAVSVLPHLWYEEFFWLERLFFRSESLGLLFCILRAKTYPGTEWKHGPERATFDPDYGRRGTLWVHGAFEPATGQATILLSPRRDSASHIQLIEQVMLEFPSDRWLLIEDNLSTHTSRETMLALASRSDIQILFLPK